MRKKTITLTVISLFVSVGLGVFYWLYSHAYVEITVTSTDKSSIGLEILNQSSGDKKVMDSNSHTVRQLVSRGSLEITIRQRGLSYFKVVESGGFLSTTKVTAVMQKEKSRVFIGDNPSPCLGRLSNMLVSYGCFGRASDAQIHLPATDRLPTRTQKLDTEPDSIVQGITTVANEPIAILRTSSFVNEADFYEAVRIQPDGSLGGVGILSGLPGGQNYNVHDYNEGFLMYSNGSGTAYYFKSPSSSFEQIQLRKPRNINSAPYALSSLSSVVAVAYAPNNNELDLDEPSTANQKIEITLSGSRDEVLEFDKRYSQVVLCGESILCLGLDNVMEMFDISSGDPRLIFKVSGVKYAAPFGEKILVIRGGDVLLVDPTKQEGYVQYAFGNYKYCGQHIGESTYVLCLINPSGKKVALEINPAADDVDTIDKKVLELYALSSIKNVSIYRQLIYLSPDVGDSTKLTSGEVGYNPETVRRVNESIDQELDKLGIDRNKYTIINPYK